MRFILCLILVGLISIYLDTETTLVKEDHVATMVYSFVRDEIHCEFDLCVMRKVNYVWHTSA